MKNNNFVIWVLIVLAVVAFLVFLTIGGKKNTINNENTEYLSMGEQNNIEIDPEKLQIAVLAEGSGEEAKAGDVVALNYTGKLANGTVFDSNVLPEFGHVEPFMVGLGMGMVIEGFDKGVIGMKVGEKRELTIAPEYGYGEFGAGDIIPPNSTLIFEVELINIMKDMQ